MPLNFNGLSISDQRQRSSEYINNSKKARPCFMLYTIGENILNKKIYSGLKLMDG